MDYHTIVLNNFDRFADKFFTVNELENELKKLFPWDRIGILINKKEFHVYFNLNGIADVIFYMSSETGKIIGLQKDCRGIWIGSTRYAINEYRNCKECPFFSFRCNDTVIKFCAKLIGRKRSFLEW